MIALAHRHICCRYCGMVFSLDSPMSSWHWDGTCRKKFFGEGGGSKQRGLISPPDQTETFTCQRCGAFDSHELTCPLADPGTGRKIIIPLGPIVRHERTVAEIKGLMEKLDV